MSRKHEALLRRLFGDRPGGNIHWREVESLLNHVGAQLENLSGTRVRVTLNGIEDVLHRPHHNQAVGRLELTHLKELLARARMTPSLYEERGG